MNRPPYRFCLPLFLLALPMAAAATGLGEVRGQPVLGERLRVEIDILGSARQPIDASCFRLIPPAGADDLPWLKQATFTVRGGAVPVLEIRSATTLRDPILQLGVQLGCGYEISRQYILLAQAASDAGQASPTATSSAPAAPPAAELPPRRLPRPSTTAGDESPAVRKTPRRPPSPPLDRLSLSGGGEAGLQLALELASLNGGLSASEAQREMLRLEFRMLMVLNEQATTQLATAEKLRNMEALLGELQSRAGDFAARVEQGGAPVVALPPVAPPTAGAAVAPPAASRPVLSEWSFYGLLLGLLLGLGGWFAWRNVSQRRARPPLENYARLADDAEGGSVPVPTAAVTAPVDLSVEPALPHAATRVDVELDGGEAAAEELPVLRAQPRSPAAALDVATVDEHFEANPVMELADIMLSFGRVKGAAQALQEYIDSNPDEALQPWIRLMDVYRMAGMQAEFEQVARNLNQHFNVAVQHWDRVAASDVAAPAGAVAVQASPHPVVQPESLEDMPRLMAMVCDLWPDGDVVGYLYQLLRDNRGGKRLGFALPVVEEILFLIELKETSNRNDKKEDMS